MRAIVRKTLIDLSGWRRVLGLILVGMAVPLVSMSSYRSTLQNRSWSVEMQTHYMVSNFLTMSFIYVAGLFLALMVAITAAGFVSKEVNEGTLLMLVSKPIERSKIVIGKFLALIVHAVLIEAIILILLSMVFRFALPIQDHTFVALLGTIPWIIMYSLLVVLIFGSVSLALSSLIGVHTLSTAVGTILVIFVFAFGSIVMPFVYMGYGISGNSFTDAWEDDISWVSRINPCYHLGNAFTPYMQQSSGGQLMPVSQLGLINSLTWVFENEDDDVFVGDSRYYYPAELSKAVHPWVSLALCLVVSVLGLLSARWAIRRMDVH
ncbi:MAG: ABC transporter permease subunit [Chloroflexota bacterium]|nr:ABC transporter permease subunit [Chloroflexota bacterium]